jgi:hypothetical protein
MEKQKKLFLNFKNRQGSTMNLVYNLVTQQDAASNMQLAASMKQDNTSVNGIAALTMAFLPGTFTASVLSAGIFSAVAHHGNKVSVSGLSWLWIAITLRLTAIVVASWYAYKRTKGRDNRPAKPEPNQIINAQRRSSIRSFSFSTLSPFRSKEFEPPSSV